MEECTQTTALATCLCGRWTWYESPVIGGLGWHGVSLKCPKCKGYFLVVIKVGMRRNQLHAEVRGIRRIRMAGEDGIRKALRLDPIKGMDDDDIEIIASVIQLLGRGGSAA